MLITLDVRSGATVDIVFVTTVVTDCSFGVYVQLVDCTGGGSVGHLQLVNGTSCWLRHAIIRHGE